jgi:hypothetical protein
VAVTVKAGINAMAAPDRTPGMASQGDPLPQTRHYERHWTPVHLDIHVDNLEVVLA